MSDEVGCCSRKGRNDWLIQKRVSMVSLLIGNGSLNAQYKYPPSSSSTLYLYLRYPSDGCSGSDKAAVPAKEQA